MDQPPSWKCLEHVLHAVDEQPPGTHHYFLDASLITDTLSPSSHQTGQLQLRGELNHRPTTNTVRCLSNEFYSNSTSIITFQFRRRRPAVSSVFHPPLPVFEDEVWTCLYRLVSFTFIHPNTPIFVSINQGKTCQMDVRDPIHMIDKFNLSCEHFLNWHSRDRFNLRRPTTA